MSEARTHINTVLWGDGLEMSKLIPDQSAHCIVTSPPYYFKRDYGLKSTQWPQVEFSPMSGLPPITVDEVACQLGLEPTIEQFVAHIVLLARDWKRILRKDGSLWMNLADSYVGNGGQYSHSPTLQGRGPANQNHANGYAGARAMKKTGKGLRVKNLMGVPWRVALALQADGWNLRADNIWHKTNAMPEATKDRCTSAHEYVFQFSLTRHYYFDSSAIAEKISMATSRDKRLADPNYTTERPARGFPIGHQQKGGGLLKSSATPEKRNKRDVWSVPTEGNKDEHYAQFPARLITPCILATCPVGGTVFDPFMGAGTTAVVARMHLRNYIGIEKGLNNQPIIEKNLAALGLYR